MKKRNNSAKRIAIIVSVSALMLYNILFICGNSQGAFSCSPVQLLEATPWHLAFSVVIGVLTYIWRSFFQEEY